MTGYEIKKEKFGELPKNYTLKIYDNKTKEIYRTFKEKTLEKILEQLIKNKFILNEGVGDFITTIPAPIISDGYQTLQLDSNELMDFYRKFKNKSETYEEEQLTKALDGVGN